MDTPPVSPDPSPSPAPPPSAEVQQPQQDGENPSLCQKSVFFLADTQHYQSPYKPSVIRISH